jgi:predicted 3-demethylubiquinone-9 3-methyltransferase (glyoxalase superfamily)
MYNSIAGPPIKLVFTNAPKPLDIGKVTLFHFELDGRNLCCSNRIQAHELLFIRACSVFAEIFFDFVAHGSEVT